MQLPIFIKSRVYCICTLKYLINRMDFPISDQCDLASVACWWWRRRIPVKRPLESLVPRLKIGGSLYTFTQKIVISLLWLTFDLEQSFSSEISRIYLPKYGDYEYATIGSVVNKNFDSRFEVICLKILGTELSAWAT